MTPRTTMRIAAALGFLGVVLGAFGAHGLKPLLTRNNMVDVWQKAVFYHLIHAVMLYVIAQRQPLAQWPCRLFLAGIALFSGSLYLLAVTNVLWLGAITPFGGVCFLVGWGMLVCCKGKE